MKKQINWIICCLHNFTLLQNLLKILKINEKYDFFSTSCDSANAQTFSKQILEIVRTLIELHLRSFYHFNDLRTLSKVSFPLFSHRLSNNFNFYWYLITAIEHKTYEQKTFVTKTKPKQCGKTWKLFLSSLHRWCIELKSASTRCFYCRIWKQNFLIESEQNERGVSLCTCEVKPALELHNLKKQHEYLISHASKRKESFTCLFADSKSRKIYM